MRAAKPLIVKMSLDKYTERAAAWGCIPREDDCPFEPKACDCEWFEGRIAATNGPMRLLLF
jgi:hypothetical protein